MRYNIAQRVTVRWHRSVRMNIYTPEQRRDTVRNRFFKNGLTMCGLLLLAAFTALISVGAAQASSNGQTGGGTCGPIVKAFNYGQCLPKGNPMARIRVCKATVPAGNPGPFTIRWDGNAVLVGGDGACSTFNTTGGHHVLSEDVSAGWNTPTIACSGGIDPQSWSLALDLMSDAVMTCTITNTPTGGGSGCTGSDCGGTTPPGGCTSNCPPGQTNREGICLQTTTLSWYYEDLVVGQAEMGGDVYATYMSGGTTQSQRPDGSTLTVQYAGYESFEPGGGIIPAINGGCKVGDIKALYGPNA